MKIWDMRKSNTLTHNHNCLMGSITFEVHHITLTSPKNTLTTIFKSILILFAFIFFAYFLFEHIMHGNIRERRNTQLCKPKTSQFCYAGAYRCYTWLASFSGEIVIYAFLLEFSSPSCQKEWLKYKEWKITWSYSSQTQATKLTCFVVHRDAHLSYKKYKIKKTLFQWPFRVHMYQYTQSHIVFVFF